MHDAYSLKRTVLTIAQPKGEINHGAILGMCEDMCGQFTGTDFGDFDLGDLLGSILGGLQEENFKIDPFITNLARGIVAVEGTIKTLSPNVNILNYFTSKVDTGLDFDLSPEKLKEMNPQIAMKLLQLFNGITDSSSKTAEALDMLEKGQIKVRTDFAFEEKALNNVNRLVGYAIRVLLIVALFIGSCLLCSSAEITNAATAFTIAFRALGLIGYAVSVFFGYRLYRTPIKTVHLTVFRALRPYDASLRSALSGRKNHPKSVTALERESYYDHKLERSPPSADHSASLLMMSRIPAAVSRRSNLSYPRLKPNQLLLLFKASIHRYSFIHGDISFSNKERREPDLSRERIRNAKHFRR